MVTARYPIDWDLALGAVVCHESDVDESYEWSDTENKWS